jgi:chromosome segregation ATPase
MINEKSPEEEIEELKIQLSNYRKENRILKERCESYEDRIEHFAIERENLSRDIMRFESMEMELKQYDIEELGLETKKLNHRVDILRRYLKAERQDNEKLNELIDKLTKELNDANYEIANLERDLRKSRIRQNQRTYNLENRLDIAYTKLAQMKYTLNEFEELGFFKRVRGKKPESLDDIDI